MTMQTEPTLFSRWVARGAFQVEQAFHLGSGSASRVTDMAIRRGADGRPYIPASSLAGLLRAEAQALSLYVTGVAACSTRNCGACPVCRLFGFGPPRQEEEEAKEQAGEASRLYVEDALPQAGEAEKLAEVRAHVGLSRRRGAAQARLQFDREVAPAGMRFDFEISVENATVTDLRLLRAVLEQWQEFGFQVGGRTTTGLGKAKLDKDSLRLYGLSFKDDDVLREYLCPPPPKDDDERRLHEMGREHLPEKSWLKGGWQDLEKEVGAWITSAAAESEEYLLPQHVFVELVVELLEPALIVGNVPNIDGERPSDMEFVKTTLADGNEVYILPGSGLKGVLRTRAEKIVRTLNYYAAGESEDEYERVVCACAVTERGRVERLNGCFSEPEDQRVVEEDGWDARRIYETSCVTCRMFGNTMMRGRLTVGEGRVVDEADPQAKLFDHVAIDRFTGWASDAKKFDTRPLMPAKEPRTTTFTFRLHLERPEPWMIGLLGLVLKDMKDDDVRLGHATRRGYGKVRAWVTGAEALVLEGSKLAMQCEAAQLPLEKRPNSPYRRARLGWESLFGEAAWPAGGVDETAAPAALVKGCHAKLMELLEGEARPNITHGRAESKEA